MEKPLLEQHYKKRLLDISKHRDTRDLRDPQKLGELLLYEQQAWAKAGKPRPLGYIYDKATEAKLTRTPNYTANPTTLEKYGRPQDLPQTPF